MAVLNILEYPDPRLKQVATPVAAVTPEIQRLVRDMAETMYAAPGVGLAATQVDVHKRIIIIDISEARDDLQGVHQPGNRHAPRARPSSRKGACRSRLLRQGHARAARVTRARAKRAGRTLRARRPTGCLPSASSTKWTIWWAKSSSNTCRRSSALASPRSSARSRSWRADLRVHPCASALPARRSSPPTRSRRSLDAGHTIPLVPYAARIGQTAEGSNSTLSPVEAMRRRHGRTPALQPATLKMKRRAAPLAGDTDSTCSWWLPTDCMLPPAVTGVARAWRASTSMRRCFRAGAARRPSSARSRRAIRRPASTIMQMDAGLDTGDDCCDDRGAHRAPRDRRRTLTRRLAGVGRAADRRRALACSLRRGGYEHAPQPASRRHLRGQDRPRRERGRLEQPPADARSQARARVGPVAWLGRVCSTEVSCEAMDRRRVGHAATDVPPGTVVAVERRPAIDVACGAETGA